MSKIIEEAVYINGGETKRYSIEEFSSIRKNDIPLYMSIKEHIYCPICKKPKLKHNSCAKKKDYFSTYQGQKHINCPYNYNKASKKILKKLLEEKNLTNLNTKLRNCIGLLFMDVNPTESPFIIKTNAKNEIVTTSSTTGGTYKKYHIPRKLLTNGKIDENEINKLKIYYGRVRLKWFIKEASNRLCIYHKETNHLICSLEFSDAAYNYLGDDVKKSVEFEAAVAFLGQFYRFDDKEHNVSYYNVKIRDSRMVYFLLY